MNAIPDRQNRENHLQYMRAARRFYSDGKQLLALQMFLTIGAPMAGLIIGLVTPDPTIKAMVALVSLSIAIVDASVLDRWIKGTVARGAKAQEQFDCGVLEIPWDQFVAGDALAPEDVHEAVARFSKSQNDDAIRDWYPVVVGELPIHLGRIVCQRTNLWYDSTLRRMYGRTVLGIAVVVALALFATALIGGFTVAEFVIGALAPASPMLIWSVREFHRQRDTVSGQDRVRKHADALWARVKAGDCGELDCDTQSRQFQDAIYNRRVTGPLIFDWVYKLRRSRLEADMNAGAQQLISELRASGQTV